MQYHPTPYEEMDYIADMLAGKKPLTRFRGYETSCESDHTIAGRRGRQVVSGVTIRDISDCVLRASIKTFPNIVDASVYEEAIRGDGAKVHMDDIKQWPSHITPAVIAMLQTQIAVEIEMLMGIYPNIRDDS